jgi:hypothetical protein
MLNNLENCCEFQNAKEALVGNGCSDHVYTEITEGICASSKARDVQIHPFFFVSPVVLLFRHYTHKFTGDTVGQQLNYNLKKPTKLYEIFYFVVKVKVNVSLCFN